MNKQANPRSIDKKAGKKISPALKSILVLSIALVFVLSGWVAVSLIDIPVPDQAPSFRFTIPEYARHDDSFSRERVLFR